jgi:hemerythrin-like domain-containing protein
MSKRHQGLIPLTHDHHHALAQARRLRVAASDQSRGLLRQSQEFVRFFQEDTISHFRQEEESVFPLAIGDVRAKPLLAQVMVEHLEIHALVARLKAQIAVGRVTRGAATELADALECHVRLEENTVFPLLETVVSEEQLVAISLSPQAELDRVGKPSNQFG